MAAAMEIHRKSGRQVQWKISDRKSAKFSGQSAADVASWSGVASAADIPLIEESVECQSESVSQPIRGPLIFH